uniref:SRF-dependent transcription regulation-associated protein n=1 Tax=Takifugu rubripes TaxID=31033 RepID=H2TUH6_TAKRU
MEPSVEEKEILEEDIKDEEEEEEGPGVEEGRDDNAETKDAEAAPQDADGLDKTKQSESLNLNNEISGLKKKKGKEMEIERNQRRADRLLMEIHAMKALVPDVVTKTALQKNLNFELVCKNPKSTISDRAVARIATHPQFSKKIEAIKSAVKAFKEERTKGGKQMWKEEEQNKVKNVRPQLPDKQEEQEGEVTGEPQKSEEGDDVFKDPVGSTFTESEKEIMKESISKNAKPATVKIVKDFKMKNKPQRKDEEKKPPPESALQRQIDEEESAPESSEDEDKPYFDDSTEERFLKQSSQSEDTDSDDGFFIGKVSKFKKKKQKQKTEAGAERRDGHETKADANDEVKPDLKPKATSFQSVFCSSLAKGAAGSGAGRGGDIFRGNPKGSQGMQRDFGKKSRFHKQERDTERHSFNSKNDSSKKAFGFGSRGRGRGAGEAFRLKAHRGGGGFSHQAPQQALHPSWEASKKRKEQQGQIMAFQGKKIKFDDDD